MGSSTEKDMSNEDPHASMGEVGALPHPLGRMTDRGGLTNKTATNGSEGLGDVLRVQVCQGRGEGRGRGVCACVRDVRAGARPCQI